MLLSRTQGIPEGDHLMRSRNKKMIVKAEISYKKRIVNNKYIFDSVLFSRDRYISVISYGVPPDPSWILWYLYCLEVHLSCTFSSLFRRRYSVVKYFLLCVPHAPFCSRSSLLLRHTVFSLSREPRFPHSFVNLVFLTRS